ncbi:MAG: hypothetical protein A3G75_00660 [Verrucomicrobia bacterium RIFCSPLOWO2_12_FULL_64_8]|nr:MAG: hypothetical protein A3G75_00660 [Verrucomicrobia bacterium RIFCSPLOWO2_12_FULL_64_8]
MRYEAFTQQGFQGDGVTYVTITRTDDAGWLQAGVFLVDLHCLGVKDAFATEMPEIDWRHELDRLIPPADRLAIHPACARKLVEGAVAYAEALGFAPHGDYKKARRAFGGVSARDCPETFTYGRDGKPLFVAGPNDDDERIDRVMRILTARLGPDGFHYILPVKPEAEEMSAAEWLRELLWDQPPGAGSFEALSGFLTALAVCPTEISASQFMAEVWAGDPPPVTGTRAALTTEKCIHAYRDEIAADLEAARDTGDPVLAVDFEVDPDSNDIGGASDWCLGFLRVLDLWQEAWRGAENRSDLQPHFAFIRAVAADGDPDGGDIPVPAGEVPAAVGGAVLALRTALRPPAAGTPSAGGA